MIKHSRELKHQSLGELGEEEEKEVEETKNEST